MMFTRMARRAGVLLFPLVLIAGCEQHNKQQNKAQETHEQMVGGGGGHQRLRAVCADDIQKYCASAEKKRRCLKENIDKLSDACKTALAERKGRKARANSGGDDE